MAILRALAAKVMAALERETEDGYGSAIIQNEERAVIVLSHRLRPGGGDGADLRAVANELIELLRAIRDNGRDNGTTPGQPAGAAVFLRSIHQRILSVLTAEPQTAKAVARKADYSPNSSHVRQALADLVSMGKVRHVEGRGYALVPTNRPSNPRQPGL